MKTARTSWPSFFAPTFRQTAGYDSLPQKKSAGTFVPAPVFT